MTFLEKLWKMWENLDISNLSQQKGEQTSWCQNQIVILQGSSRNSRIDIEMKKNPKIPVNKPAYLGLPILELSKILIY